MKLKQNGTGAMTTSMMLLFFYWAQLTFSVEGMKTLWGGEE